jgi:hypothetical protein
MVRLLQLFMIYELILFFVFMVMTDFVFLFSQLLTIFCSSYVVLILIMF